MSIAAVLNAQGQASSIKDGLGRAGDIVAQMKQDAKELPGEFSDLLGIFQSGVGAAGNAGLDAVKFEKLAANAMAAGKAMSVPLDQAGRELAMLMDGRAGAHNVFGSRLGIRAADFNHLGGEERVAKITQALGAFEPAIKAFGSTFDAMWSTAIDNAKSFGVRATGPLFDQIKVALGDLNAYFNDNGSVSQFADRIGRGLANAFQSGRRFIEEWGPAVATFADNAYSRIQEIWSDVGPTVRSIGESIKGFLTDNGSFDKILDILKLYASLKGAAAAAPLFGAMSEMSGAGGGAAGAAIGALGTIGLTVGAVTIAAQVANLLGGTSGKEYDMFDGGGVMATIGNLFIRKNEYGRQEDLSRSTYLDRLVKTFGEMDMASQSYQLRMADLISSGDELGASMVSAAAAAKNAAAAMNAIGGPSPTETPDGWTDSVQQYMGLMAVSGLAGRIAGEASGKALKAKAHGGGGGGGSMKVEITISSNQAPGQIAKEVVAHLSRLRRHPNASPRTPNFTIPRG